MRADKDENISTFENWEITYFVFTFRSFLWEQSCQKYQQFLNFEVTVTDMRYFIRSKCSLREKIWLDVASSLQVRTLILLREVGYLFYI